MRRRTQALGFPVGHPAGNHSRSRLKPSPISDRHVIELVVRSLEALRLRTSGHVRALSRRACLAHHPWSLSPGRRTKHPVTACSLTSFRSLAHLSSPQLGLPLWHPAQVWGWMSPFRKAPTHYSVALSGFWSVELFTRPAFRSVARLPDDTRHGRFRDSWLPHQDTLTGDRKGLAFAHCWRFHRQLTPHLTPLHVRRPSIDVPVCGIRSIPAPHPRTDHIRRTVPPLPFGRAMAFASHDSDMRGCNTTNRTRAFLGRPHSSMR
jgi:hypothetical protein